MSKIEEIDRNLAVTDRIGEQELIFRKAGEPPFAVYGLLFEQPGGPFFRIPLAVAKQANDGVVGLRTKTAGGRVRFCTDSACVAIRVRMPDKCLMPHMTFIGSSGFDLYRTEGEKNIYAGSLIPPVDRGAGYESLIRFPDRSMRELTINFPLYDSVDELLIGLEPDASVQGAGGYRTEKPVLFYGSSITQGGCASRPGNSYQAVISRMLDCDYRNLGWSGSALGEPAMAEYIAAQPMSLCFLDYDHNSPSAEHLAATHEPFFRIIREKNPDLPVIFTSKTDLPRSQKEQEENEAHRRIIRQTYENAVRRGDKNVRYIDGSSVFSVLEPQGLAPDSCTVDGCHPNDLGFFCMAKVFGRAIGEMLGWL